METDEVLKFIAECNYRLVDINNINNGSGPKPLNDPKYYIVDDSKQKSLTKDPKVTIVEMRERKGLTLLCKSLLFFW